MPKAYLHTLGCRLNQAETAIIANSLKEKGYQIVGQTDKADLTVINTCTVTEQADSKCRQAVRQSIRNNPDTFVAVVGCYAQMAVKTISEIDGVDMIVGNEHKLKLVDHLNGLSKQSVPTVIHSPKISRGDFTIESTGLYDTHTRANLKIQDGCNFVCSFCIIATARGPARSREFSDIIDEAKKLVDGGFRELVLTGVNIGTYQQNGQAFIDILSELEKINGLERIRISSIEPTTIDKSIIDYIAASAKVCRYLHIPLQSGDDRILESMRRKHTAREFSDIIEYAYNKIPDAGIGTDIMVGYPGETDQEFKNSKKLVADLPISFFHVFTYSDRKGTTAFNLKSKVEHQTKKLRNRIMIEMGERKKYTFMQSFIGKTQRVLFEEENAGYWEGLTDNYLRVKVKSDRNLKNIIKSAGLRSVDEGALLGELV